MDQEYQSNNIAQTIVLRLIKVLPFETGNTIENAEQDKLFISTKTTLLRLSRTALISEVLASFGNLLDQISKRDRNEPLSNRNVYSLRSLIVVTKLLAQCTEAHWDHCEPGEVRRGRVPITFGEPGFVKPYIKYHTVLPPKLNSAITKNLLEKLINLHSESMICETTSILSNGSIQMKSHIGIHPYKSHIDEIDEYCSMVCRYLSASNWSVAYQIIQQKLEVIKNFNAEEYDVVPNIDIFEYIYLDQNSIGMIFQDLWQCLSALRKPLHQSLLLHFLSKSLEYWCIARPEEIFNTTKEGSPLQLEASGLFDYIYATTENCKFTDGVFRFLSVLVCFFPGTFETFMNAGIKRFTANSKKLKFLSSLHSSVHVKHISDGTFDCFGIFCIVAEVIFDFDPNNPIILYAKQVHNDISLNFHSNFGDNMTASLMHIYANYMIAYTTFDYENTLKDIKFHLGRKDLETGLICFITTGLRALGSYDAKFNIYQSIINTISGTLQSIIRRQSLLLLKTRAAGSSSKRSLSTSNSEMVSVPILSNILQCYIPSPYSHYIDANYEGTDHMGAITEAMDPVITCLLDMDPELSSSARNFIQAFFEKKKLTTVAMNMKEMDDKGDNPPVAVYLSAGYLLNALAEKIIEIDMSDSRIESLFIIIRDVLEGRLRIAKMFKFREASKGVITRFEPKDTRIKMYTNLESAILISLCSPDIEIYKLTAGAIMAVISDAMEVEDLNSNILSCPLLYNRDQYNEFDLNSYVITGHVALQKRIRKLVYKFTVATDGIMNAWSEIYSRFSSNNDFSTFVSERRNYSGMLASLSECILETDVDTNVRASEVTPIIYEFLEVTIDMMVAPNLLVCDAAKETLSREFGSSTIKQMFVSLTKLINRILDSGKKDLIFQTADLIISLIKNIILRCSEEALTLDIAVPTGLYTIMNYLDAMEDNIDIIRMKIRCVKLAGEIKTNDQYFDIIFTTKQLYDWTCLMYKWFEKAAFKTENEGSTYKSLTTSERKLNEIENMLNDLALESAKATSIVSKNVRIIVPQANTEEDYLQAKSTQCANFFSIGVHALEKYSSESGTTSLTARGSSSTLARTISSSVTSSSERSLKAVSQRSSALTKYIVEILSSILQNNADVGLKFGIPMGLHSNPKVRSASIKVLKTIMEQGVSREFNTNQSEKVQTLLKYLRSNLSLAVLLCDSCPAGEVDSLASSLLSLYMSSGLGLELIKAAVTKEIQRTTKVVELLRRNSVATRMLAIYAKTHGAEYLSSTLGPVMQSFLDDPAGHVFELNADKLEENRANENIEKFMNSLRSFSEAFINSLDIMPSSFREICSTIRDVSIQSFPEAEATSVGSFLFLRFFCPAIVAPEANNLVKHHLRRDIRRSFLLVAKVIQNMANGSLYSLKLPLLYEKMGELNQINDRITTFLTESVKLAPSNSEKHETLFAIGPLITIDENENSAPVKMDEEQMMFLQEYLYAYLETINAAAANSLVDDGPTNTYKGNDVESLPSLSVSMISAPDSLAMTRFDELVEAVGPPRQKKGYEIPQQITTNSTENGMLLYEFMTKNAAKDFGPILEKQMIKEGVSDDGLPFMVISMGNFEKATIGDPDMVTYRLFQIMSKIWNNKFSFFVDFTSFDEKNYVDPSIIENMIKMTPSFASDNCVGSYYVNCSNYSLPLVQQIVKLFESASVFSPYFTPCDFICTFDQELPITPYGMSRKTRNVLKDGKTEYDNIFQYDPKLKDFIEVKFKVGNEYVQVCQANPTPVSIGGRTAYVTLLDVYHATDFVDVKLANKKVNNGFIFNLQNSTNKTFSGLQRNDVLRDINNMVKKYSENSSSTSLTDTAIHSLSSIISTLVVIGLFGLFAEDNETRNASFDLMATLGKMYGLSETEIGRGREGLYFPMNAVGYYLNLSALLAERFPDWTYNFCKSFIESFSKVPSKCRDSAIHIVSPWLKDLYHTVYLENDKRGPRRMKYLISGFIKVTTKSEKHIASSSVNIWKPLFQQNELIPLLVDIIIGAAIDKQTSGDNCEDIISLLLGVKSEQICEIVLFKARNLSRIAIDSTNEAEDFLNSTISWAEITVYAKTIDALFFDEIELSSKFLPEICVIGSLFTNNGPYELKFFIHKLAINVFHNFTTLETLSMEVRNQLNLILERLSGSRGKLLFGIHSVVDSEMNGSHDSAKISALSEITLSLMEIMELAGGDNVELKRRWRTHWCAYISDAAFSKKSIMRSRALSILGDLVEDKDAETVIIKLEHLLTITRTLSEGNDVAALDMNVCIIHAAGILANKLPPKSPLLPLLFWQGIYCTQFPETRYFIGSTILAINCLTRMDGSSFFDGDLVGGLTRVRNAIGPSLDSFDKLCSTKYSPELFDVFIVTLLSRGIHSSVSRHHTLGVIQKFLEIRLKNDKILLAKRGPKALSSKAKISPFIYVFFLFIYSRSHKECRKYLSCLEGENNKWMDIGDNILLPKVLMQYDQADFDQIAIGIYLATVLISDPKADESALLKFVRFLVRPGDAESSNNKRILCYSSMEGRLRSICEHSANINIVSSCQELVSAITTLPGYDINKHREYTDEFAHIPKMYNYDNPLYKELVGQPVSDTVSIMIQLGKILERIIALTTEK